MHRNYLLSIRHLPPKTVQRDRNAIISTLQRDIQFSYWYGSISYKDKKFLAEKVRDRLSFDSLFGIRQLSLFEDIPEEELHPQPEDINPTNN